ncbi:hypothetical protein QAD02_020352 [Eretmocerus hayati]|uniref:Uncharacterized protein n=1 Tax=Eretmocerus hayati TaxID=131215 RepID=A0ACC2PMA4_9HYME|nr:hypothetical protein QAD02_020352 [Eretmocerus hayati]
MRERTNPFQRTRYEKRSRGERKKGKMRILSWNIAGEETLSGKQWNYLRVFEIVCISDTWLEGKDRNRVENKLEGFDCSTIEAKKEKKKGRASGGLTVAIKKNLETRSVALSQEIMKSELQIGREKW